MRHSFWCLLILGFLAPNISVQAQNQGQLVVFVQPGRSISQDFIRNSLPQIEALSQKRNISMKVVDASKGAPSEVSITPSVFYKKGDEYLPYHGRYSDMSELGRFVQSNGQNTNLGSLERNEVAVWRKGRATLAAQCKMHPVEGSAAGFDEAKAWEALVGGMVYFGEGEKSDLPGVTRSFYLDFFPEKTSDGLMLIQLALYSEFDMDTPLFQSKLPSGSEWKEWEVAFAKAGKRLEAMLLAQVGSNENGDGFEFVRNNVPTREWDSLTTVEDIHTGTLAARRK